MLIDSILVMGRGLLSSSSNEVAQLAGSMLVSAIWQGALVALCVAGALRITRQTTAALRFSIWVAGFVAALCLPFWPILWSRFAPHASLSVASVTSTHVSPWIQVDLRWSVALALLWAAASLYRAVDLATHAVRLRSVWKDAVPVPADKLALLPVANEQAGRRIEVCTTLRQDRPGVIGFFAPRILIPEWLLDRLTVGELTQIVLHETEHIRRGDDWSNLLQKLGLVLFPLNPALLWMDRRLSVEREMACDEAVVRATRAPRAYAACLTNLAEHGRAWKNQAIHQAAQAALTLGAWRKRSELVGRVHSILRNRNASEANFATLHSRGIFAVLACGLMVGSAELARCPQLIAFVPAHTENMASAQVRPERNIQPTIGRSAAAATMQPVSTRDMGQVHMKNLKAVVPARNAASYMSYNDIPVAKTAMPWKATPASIRQFVHQQGKPEFGTPSSEMAANDDGPDGLSPVRAEARSSAPAAWLVLTTWEEVATIGAPTTPQASASAMTDGSTQEVADVDPAANASLSVSAPQDDPQPTQQLRVTRVIFRVVPASFVSPAPHTASTRTTLREGWLVIQL